MTTKNTKKELIPADVELREVKEQLYELNISYHPDAGVKVLKEKLTQALAKKENESIGNDTKGLSKDIKSITKQNLKDALTYRKVTIICNDPSIQHHSKIHRVVGNSKAWHEWAIPLRKETYLPNIIINVLEKEMYQYHLDNADWMNPSDLSSQFKADYNVSHSAVMTKRFNIIYRDLDKEDIKNLTGKK